MQGILILGHGSRENQANEDVRFIARLLAEKLAGNLVLPAFLSFSPPDLAGGIASLVDQGVDKVIVAPLFLFSGNHVKRDIPRELQIEQEKYRGRAEIIYTRNLGRDQRIAEILLDRIREVI